MEGGSVAASNKESERASEGASGGRNDVRVAAAGERERESKAAGLSIIYPSVMAGKRGSAREREVLSLAHSHVTR